MFWKDGFFKKIALKYDLSCIIWKDGVFFPKNMIFFLWAENERWSFSKKYMEISYFSQIFWKDGLFKKLTLKYDLSCIIWKDGIFSPKKHDIFSLDVKWKTIFLKEYVETCTGVTNTTPSLSAKKNQRWSYPAKIHLKVIDILDRHSRKRSNISLYLYGDLYRCFHILLSSEETRKT